MPIEEPIVHNAEPAEHEWAPAPELDTTLFGNDGPVAKHTAWGSTWKDRGELKQAYFDGQSPRHQEAVNELQRVHLLQSRADDEAARKEAGLPEEEEGELAEQFPPIQGDGTYDPGLQAEFMAAVEADGIPADEWNAVLEIYAENGSPERMTAEAAEAVLRTQWGEHYDALLAAAREAVRPFPQVAAFLERSGLGNDPVILTALAERGEKRKAIEASITRIQADPAYMDSSRPGHDDLVEKVRLGFRRLYAGH